MKYKVITLNKKHIDKINKDVISAELSDERGVVTENVQIWQGFPDFQTITFGSEVEGEVIQTTNGKFTNVTLYAPKNQNSAQGGGYKAKVMEAAMQRKDASISKFQDNKEESIKTAGILRDTTLLTMAEVGKDGATDEVIKEVWERWHSWLTNKYNQPF